MARHDSGAPRKRGTIAGISYTSSCPALMRSFSPPNRRQAFGRCPAGSRDFDGGERVAVVAPWLAGYVVRSVA